MRPFFGLIALAMLVAAKAGAGLSWDGSAYLFAVLDTQRTFSPNSRFINVPLQLPVLLLNLLTSNTSALGTIFGLSYALVPLLALVASWFVVRERADTLFIWSALGIGLGLLPGQFLLVSEANMALQLGWPIVLAALIGIRRGSIPLVVVLALALFSSHPYAIGLLAIAACLAFVTGWRQREVRRVQWVVALLFGSLSAVAALRFLRSRTQYESEQISLGIVGWASRVSLQGWPTVALIGAVLAAASTCLAPFAARRGSRRLVRCLGGVGLLGIGVTAVSLSLWASDAHRWQWANKYSYPALPITICFMAMATLEYLATDPTAGEPQGDQPFHRRHRLRMLWAIGGAFMLVITIQSLTWSRLTSSVLASVTQSPWACVSMAPIQRFRDTPLDQFATPYLALLLQGRAPSTVLLSGDMCGTASFVDGVRLDSASDAVQGWHAGWFDLGDVQRRLAAEQGAGPGCTIILTSGWHQTETDDPYWWRWSDGQDARVAVRTGRAGEVVLSGKIESFRQPNTVEVLVNGEPSATLVVDWAGIRPFQGVPLVLRAGQNTIQLRSGNQPLVFDGRPLAIDVGDLAITPTDGAAACTFHP